MVLGQLYPVDFLKVRDPTAFRLLGQLASWIPDSQGSGVRHPVREGGLPYIYGLWKPWGPSLGAVHMHRRALAPWTQETTPNFPGS